MAWLCMVAAGLCEVAGVINMKKYTETKRKIFILGCVCTFAVSFSLLSYAMKTIPMATAYAVWTGIGTAGSALVGFIVFKEKATVLNALFISMIACGAVGLKLTN